MILSISLRMIVNISEYPPLELECDYHVEQTQEYQQVYRLSGF